jgi:energy-coupling factor transport system substrate-specific component
MNPIGWVQGLEGLTLAVVLAGFMFVEEAGVPLPFAPGDILLAIGGIAIAGGRVDPVTLVLASFVATVAGAVLGREIFSFIGWERLMRVATRLRAGAPLERAAGLLQRSGWRGVFTARLIPGLRVETTRVAGVSRMPRRIFLAGLVPSAVVYIAAFVGLGAAFGRPILALIHASEHNVLLAALALAVAVAFVLLLRGPVQRILSTLAPEGWAGTLRIRTDSAGLILIPACIGINFAGHAVAVWLKLPLFLDSTGTILCAVVAGPWVGGSVGFISNLVSSNTIEPIASSYAVVSLAIGFAAGMWTRLTWRNRASGWIALWLACFAIGSLMSTPLNVAFNDGHSGVPLGDAIYGWLSGAHVPGVAAAFAGEAAIDLPDKLVTVVVALLIVQGLPRTQPGARGVDLDLGEALTFIFRTPHWRRKLLAAALCLLFSWLVIPLLWFTGYSVEVARRVRDGSLELPPWGGLRQKLKDGLLLFIVFIAWNIPGILLSIPDFFVTGKGTARTIATILTGLGSLWGLFALVALPPIYSQFLQRGFRAAFNVGAIVARFRSTLGLSMVVGALVIALSTVWVIGVLAIGIGVLFTLTYASWIGSYLVGKYAAVTDHAVGIDASISSRPGAVPRVPAS